MFSKRTIVSGLVTFVVLFAVGWLLWSLIFASTWAGMTSVEATREPNMLFMAIGLLIAGWLMAFIYPRGYEGGSPAAEGFRFGLVIWALLSLAVGFWMQAFWPDNTGAFIFARVLELVQYGAAGIVLGIVADKMTTPERVVAQAPAAPAAPEPAAPAAPEPEVSAEAGEAEGAGGESEEETGGGEVF